MNPRKTFTSLLDRIDRLGPVRVLQINAALAGFVVVAHGGALLLVLLGNAPPTPEYAASVRAYTPISLSLAALVALASLAGLRSGTLRGRILALQSAVIFFSTLALLAWAGSLLVRGLPRGGFSWSPGLLTATVVYATQIFTRHTLGESRLSVPAARRCVLGAAFLSAAIDLGVLARFLVEMPTLLQG